MFTSCRCSIPEAPVVRSIDGKPLSPQSNRPPRPRPLGRTVGAVFCTCTLLSMFPAASPSVHYHHHHQKHTKVFFHSTDLPSPVIALVFLSSSVCLLACSVGRLDTYLDSQPGGEARRRSFSSVRIATGGNAMRRDGHFRSLVNM